MASTTTKSPPAKAKAKISAKSAPSVIQDDDSPYDVEERLDYIAKAAYYKAAERGFVPGEELNDWLEAEAEFEEIQSRG